MRVVVAGVDTGVGKTIFSAALAQALDAYYWKPVQSGGETETDSQTVARLAPGSAIKILAESYCLKAPLSPHRAAELEGVVMDVARLDPPARAPLVIETAGGLMTPFSRAVLNIDLIAHWRAPVVLCASTRLGAINHCLLNLDVLRSRGIDVLGVAFIGEDAPDTIRTIADFSRIKILGRLPHLSPLTPATLARAFADHFNRADFL